MNTLEKFLKIIIINIVFLFINVACPGQNAHIKIDRAAFYAALAAGDIADINTQLHAVGGAANSGGMAFEGALLMKKAGFAAKPKEKMTLFREGETKLEQAIARDSANGEFRFLRLVIQEHAPKVVHYNANLGQDKEAVTSHYKSLPPETRKAVIEYTEKSKVLHQSDFITSQ